MSDDPAQIRQAARRVSALAAAARTQSHQITAQSRVRWAGLAAQAYRDRLGDRARDFSNRAIDLDDLAKALMAHARHVEDHETFLSGTLHGLEAAPGPAGGLAGLVDEVGGMLP